MRFQVADCCTYIGSTSNWVGKQGLPTCQLELTAVSYLDRSATEEERTAAVDTEHRCRFAALPVAATRTFRCQNMTNWVASAGRICQQHILADTATSEEGSGAAASTVLEHTSRLALGTANFLLRKWARTFKSPNVSLADCCGGMVTWISCFLCASFSRSVMLPAAACVQWPRPMRAAQQSRRGPPAWGQRRSGGGDGQACCSQDRSVQRRRTPAAACQRGLALRGDLSCWLKPRAAADTDCTSSCKADADTQKHAGAGLRISHQAR